MEPPNDHYDSPWKEAIEHYFPDFISTPIKKGFPVILLQIRHKNEKIGFSQG